VKELNTEGFEQQISQRIPFLIPIILLRLGLVVAALGLTLLIGVALAGIGCYYYTMFLFEPLDVARWLALDGLMWLFLLVYVALMLLCSMVSRSQVLAGGLSFGLLVILAARPIARLGGRIGGRRRSGGKAGFWGERWARRRRTRGGVGDLGAARALSL
jgi:hypothetical protein